MGGLSKWSLTLAAVLASAFVLAACGGGDDDTAPSSTAPATSGETSGEGATMEEPSSTDSDAGGGGSDGGGAADGEAAQKEDPELPERGTVSARSRSFQKYSGKSAAELQIAEFGVEGDSGIREEVEANVQAYLEAIGNEEWEKACSYLAGMTRAQFGQLIERLEEPLTCGDVLRSFVTQTRKKTGISDVYAPEGIASVRIKEGPGGGFALFHGSDGDDYWMAVRRGGGEWKLLSTSPQPFQQ